ncbi:unnamed protein product [Soboliphyme baturini]|uniref:Large ribosomal subunit protein mL50 n=1 Tax=Soboliphyme baturini TaxID=241478 RepID=A0A183IM82_9BILA|nr:unnamed protein product [Soboliphyme baturini]
MLYFVICIFVFFSFLKFTKPYNPPEDTEQRLLAVFKEAVDDASEEHWKKFSFEGKLEQKCRFLSLAEKALGKRILSSYLHDLKTVEDVLNYFNNITAYSEMSRSDRSPQNLHIMEDAVRFHPLTDTQFDGVSAFPKSSTYVSSLRYRRYLKGYRAKTEWHHFEDKNFDYTVPPPDAPWTKKKAERMDTVKPFTELRLIKII